jgi:regulator of protease activity HflC (stomatin/prohibitin superfamily)
MSIKTSYRSLVVLLLISLLAGCYRNQPVESYQMGLVMDDGVSITKVVGPGLHSNGAWRAELYTINVSNITTSWNDPSLVTKDKQPIGLTMNITFARKRDAESVANLYNRYNSEAINDDALKNLVLSKVPGVAKTISTKYTLDQMLGIAVGEQAVGRTALAQEVFDLLKSDLDQIYVELAAVEIADISPSEEFMASLNAKAQAQINMEVANQETKLLTEQLAQEKAKTEIELERARRENAVNQEMAKAYEESPELFQLRMLELTAGMLNQGDVVIYVPEGANITSVLTQSPVVPVE